jgi:energy-coupling factor transporter ATP-binding protein EcfA2
MQHTNGTSDGFERVLEIIVSIYGTMLSGKIVRLDGSKVFIKPLFPLYRFNSGEVIQEFSYSRREDRLQIGRYVLFLWTDPFEGVDVHGIEVVSESKALNVAEQMRGKLMEALTTSIEVQVSRKLQRKWDDYNTHISKLARSRLKLVRQYQSYRKDLEDLNKKQTKLEAQKREYLEELEKYQSFLGGIDRARAQRWQTSPESFNKLYNDWPRLLESRGYYSGKKEEPTHNAVQQYLLCILTAFFSGSLVLLNGPVGVGKTSIVTHSAGICTGTPGSATILPVRPSWIDSSDLLGFFDPLSETFRPTPFIHALKAAYSTDDRLALICLDEMNLARIENYGADLLSQLEYSRTSLSAGLQLYSKDIYDQIQQEYVRLQADQNLTSDEQHRFSNLRLLCEQYIHYLAIPRNLVLLGTLNTDQTTYDVSPKVIDRSWVVTFPHANLQPQLNANHEHSDPLTCIISLEELKVQTKKVLKNRNIMKYAEKAWVQLLELNQILTIGHIGIPLGHRASRDFEFFWATAKTIGVADTNAIVGHFMFTKIMPRVYVNKNRLPEGRTGFDRFMEIAKTYQKFDPANILGHLQRQFDDQDIYLIRYFGSDLL